MYSVQKTQSVQNSKLVGRYIKNICVCLLIILCYVFKQYRIMDYISVIALVLYLIEYFISDNHVFWKYFYLLFSSLGVLVGVIMCESIPLYLRELASFTHRTGAIPPIVLSIWVEIVALRILDHRIDKRHRKNVAIGVYVRNISIVRIIQRYSTWVVFALNLFLFALVATKPFFLYGVDRFGYARNYMPGIATRLKYLSVYLVPFVIMAVQSKAKWTVGRRISAILLTYSPYILFAVWIGERFGLLWLLFYTILIPATDIIDFAGRKIRENLKMAITIVLAFAAVLILFYVLSSGGLMSAMVAMVERVSMQGQLWWKVFSMEADKGLHIAEFFDELRAISHSIKSSGQIREYGVYRLMRMYAPSAYVDAYLKAGIRYSAQGIELAYYYFKDISLLVWPAFKAFVLVFATNLYKRRTQANRFVEAFIGAKLLNMFIAAFSQGDWFALFSVKALMWYGFLAVMEIITRRNKGR